MKWNSKTLMFDPENSDFSDVAREILLPLRKRHPE
jgi:hypothetical protein